MGTAAGIRTPGPACDIPQGLLTKVGGFVSNCSYHDRTTVRNERCSSPEALGTLALTAIIYGSDPRGPVAHDPGGDPAKGGEGMGC